MLQTKFATVWILLLALCPPLASAQQPSSINFANPDGLAGLTYTSSSSNPADPNPTDLAPRPAAEPGSTRSFHSIALGLTASTLGGGVELATPLSRSLHLRSSINFLAFNYPINIDGIVYASRLNLSSSSSAIDWFPTRTSFHISPGVLYAHNTMSAVASIVPGGSFMLGSQPFTNSVDDPMAGTATVVFPHNVAPMLMLGFGNLLPRRGHLSFPIEIGAAYTGAAVINVHLNGTACTTEGCVAFATNPEAQSSLQQEIAKINKNLSRVPVYPILSLGFAYCF